MNENKIEVGIYQVKYIRNVCKLISNLTKNVEIVFRPYSISTSFSVKVTVPSLLDEGAEPEIIHSFFIDCSLIEYYHYNTDEEYVSLVVNSTRLNHIIKNSVASEGLDFVLPNTMEAGFFSFRKNSNKVERLDIKCSEVKDVLDLGDLSQYEPNLKVYPQQITSIFNTSSKNVTVTITSTEDRRGLEFFFNTSGESMFGISSSLLQNKNRTELSDILEYDKPFKATFNLSDLIIFKTPFTYADNLCEFRILKDSCLIYNSNIGSYGSYVMTMINGNVLDED